MEDVDTPMQVPGRLRSNSDRPTFHENEQKEDKHSTSSNNKTRIGGKVLNSTSQLVVRSTYLYGCVHGAVDQLLPACFKALERDMGFTPQSLGTLSSATRIAHVLTCPLWGFVIDCCGRRRIFSSSAIGWGVGTAALFYITQKWQPLPVMCILGVFMAAMGPLSQKVIGQEVPENERGHSFGLLHFFQSFGRVVSLIITTSVSSLSALSIEGWRYALAGFGLFSIIVGIMLGCRIPDCPYQRQRQKEQGRWYSIRDIAYVFSNGSVWVMLIMGVLNGIPRSAIHFSTMYFQYCNIPDWWASFIVSSSWIAAMIVAPVIGYTGDIVHSRYPNHGRQCLAQVCIVVRCMLMTVMLTCVPRVATSVWIFVLLAILIGFLAGWPGVGVNRPILTEIVNPEHRATTFALVSCLEGVGAAALGAPIVGYLCENVFGYIKMTRSVSMNIPTEVIQLGNARAIALSMLCMTVGPWLLTVIAYGFLHLTYKVDKTHGSEGRGRRDDSSLPLLLQENQPNDTLPLVNNNNK